MSGRSEAYGAALWQLAAETGQTEAVADGLALFETALAEVPDYGRLLTAPVIPPETRRAALEQVWAERVPLLLCQWLWLLCRTGQPALLPESARAFRTRWRGAEAQVVSAVPLSAETRLRLQQLLSDWHGGPVALRCTVQPSLLGGLQVRLSGTVWDGTLRHRLETLQAQLSEIPSPWPGGGASHA